MGAEYVTAIRPAATKSFLLEVRTIACNTSRMIIGSRIRELRDRKRLSQGDIEKRTGLLRCYISRVENGHTVPAIETLEKIARAVEVPLYRLFYEGEVDASRVARIDYPKDDERLFGRAGKDARFLRDFAKAVRKLDDRDQRFLMFVAYKMARGRH